jgi:hypothetical protein
MVNPNIDIFEMSYEESLSYFKRLKSLEKIRCINGPNPSSLPLDNMKYATSSVGKSKNHKASNMWCHYCDKNNHNTADCKTFDKFKQQKITHFIAKYGPRKKSLTFLFEEINTLKRHLKSKKTTSIKKRKTESIISIEINESI